jgi:co-chaperonin GroES (HSP10)
MAEDLITGRLMPGRCIIEPVKAPDHSGEIILPENARTEQMWGCVMNAGDNPAIQDGDYVVFERWAGAHFEMEDRSDLVLVRHENVLAVISDG